MHTCQGSCRKATVVPHRPGFKLEMDFFLAMTLQTGDIVNLIGLLWEQMKLWGERGPWNYVEWLVLSPGYRDMRRLP